MVILIVATKTKNKKTITNEKMIIKDSEDIQEKGWKEWRLSEAVRWDGAEIVIKINPASKMIVKIVCGGREFNDSLGAKVEM